MIRRSNFWKILATMAIIVSARPALSESTAPEFQLLRNGRPNVNVKVVSFDPVVMFANTEFVQILAAATQTPDYTDVSGSIRVNLGIAGDGSSKACDELMQKYSLTPAELGQEGFLFAGTSDRMFYLTAFSGKGVLNGVYKVLEKSLGIAYPRPLVQLNFPEPVRRSIALPTPYTETPAFDLRGLSISRMIWKTPSENMLDWMCRSGMNFQAMSVGSFQCINNAVKSRGFQLNTSGHSFLFWVPGSEYGKSNPEYFSLQDGERVTKGKGSQLALGNPDVIDLLVEKMSAYKEKYPNIQTLAFGINDSDKDGIGFGNDPDSVKLDSPLDIPPEGSPVPRFYTTRYVRAANMIVERLNEKWPELQLHIYAYNMNGGTIAPPNSDIHPNLKVEFCPLYRCYQHAMNDPNCPRNQLFYNWLKGWAEKTQNIYIRDYYIQLTDTFPMTNLFVLKKDIEFYSELGVVGAVPETIPDGPNAANVGQNEAYGRWLRAPQEYVRFWDTSALLHFAFGRLMWNPDESVESIVELYCRNYYGEAWEPMYNYHLIMNRNGFESAHPGEAPEPDSIRNYGGWIFYGPWCKCWNWRPRVIPMAFRYFNITKAEDLPEAAEAPIDAILEAENIAKLKYNTAAIDRIDRDRQILIKYLLGLGYEIDWRTSKPGNIRFSQTPTKGNIPE